MFLLTTRHTDASHVLALLSFCASTNLAHKKKESFSCSNRNNKENKNSALQLSDRPFNVLIGFRCIMRRHDVWAQCFSTAKKPEPLILAATTVTFLLSILSRMTAHPTGLTNWPSVPLIQFGSTRRTMEIGRPYSVEIRVSHVWYIASLADVTKGLTRVSAYLI